jgi:phage terminase large subunit-like protein
MRLIYLRTSPKFPQKQRDQIFSGYTQADFDSLDFDWGFWGRPEQIAPPGTRDNWLILAGRGFGKTRTGAEWVGANMCGDTPLTGGRWRHVALIAETAAGARDVMVGDGKMLSDTNAGSGILQVHPKDFRQTTSRRSAA